MVYHLQKDSKKSGWKVNGTSLFGSFQWKVSESGGTPEEGSPLFSGRNVPNGNSRSIFFKAIFDTSFRSSRPFFR